MAQQYVSSAGTLIIPGAYSQWTAAQENSGLATTGVIALVGEADAGPIYSLEEDLEENSFGPDQVADVLAKYKSGNLVDAFRAISVPSADPAITGSPNRFILVKTNDSLKASSQILDYASASYSYLADKSYGRLGNLIYYTITAATTEVAATTGTFTWINNVGTSNSSFRVNGGSAQAMSLIADRTPAQVVSAIGALTNLTVSGGVLRTVIPATAQTLTLVAVASQITLSFTTDWTTTPTAGDTLYIPAASAIAGTGTPEKNAGAYMITSATSNTIVATKLSDAGATGASPGTITAPENDSHAASDCSADFTVHSAIVVTANNNSDSTNPGNGYGKTIEWAELTTGTDLLSRSLYTLVAGSPVAFAYVSKTGSAKLLYSSAEYRAQLNASRQYDSITETLAAGGEIALKIGYTGTSAQVVIDNPDTTVGTPSRMTITVVGGAGTSLGALSFSEYPTLADLASYINSKTGYSCSIGSAVLGSLPCTALDKGTFYFGSTFGVQTGRIKIDAYRFFNKVNDESVLVQLQDSATTTATVERADAGLPVPVAAATYLANGAKGGTLSETVQLAFDALELCNVNFVVPLFSRDASSDITDSLTESTSTYVIDTVNAAAKTHVLKMSTLKKRKPRQALLSKKDTFDNAKSASANLASFRCAMAFQDCKNVDSTGTLKQFQPWMTAGVAAGMQSAGFYKSIFNKLANISGAVQAAADFDDRNDTEMEEALLAGLLPMKRFDTGGWKFVSDQTTYGKDSNFVYNSLQATYVADVMASTLAQRMESAFVGQSVADISAPLAKAFLDAVMSDFKRLKLIASSDDAPSGYKNAVIRISGTSLVVSLEVKLAGCIYFVPISFVVSQVQQTA